MKKTTLLLLLILVLSSPLYAQIIEKERRVEEDKRLSLEPAKPHVSEKRIYREEPASAPGGDRDIDRQYFNSLLARKVARDGDLLKTLSILMGVDEKYPDFTSMLEFIDSEEFLPPGYADRLILNEPLRKGVLAYAYCRALDIKGGVWLNIFGTNQRYAVKELSFMGIMDYGLTGDIVSGEELISILIRAAEYMARDMEAGE